MLPSIPAIIASRVAVQSALTVAQNGRRKKHVPQGSANRSKENRCRDIDPMLLTYPAGITDERYFSGVGQRAKFQDDPSKDSE